MQFSSSHEIVIARRPLVADHAGGAAVKSVLVRVQISTGPEKGRPKDSFGKVLKPLPEGTEAKAEGDLLILAVGNGKQAGGQIPLCPNAGMLAQSLGASASDVPCPACMESASRHCVHGSC